MASYPFFRTEYKVNGIERKRDMSEIRVVENQRFTVKVKDLGAELCSIYDKANDRELIWNADPEWWPRHAPILFPSVGVTHKGQYRYQGKTYAMSQHGFARDMEFTFLGLAGNTLTHQLKTTAETKENYPFDFVLEVRHILEEDGLVVDWTVKNAGTGEMLFTIGAHPAFRVPAEGKGAGKDYKLTFDGQKELSFIYINEEGTAKYREVKTLPLENGAYTVGEHLFDNGVLIFENKQVEKVGFAFPDGSEYLTVECEGFPFVGVWTKPNAPFICLEPWYGRCDNEDFEDEYEKKVGVEKLPAGGAFHAAYKIHIA